MNTIKEPVKITLAEFEAFCDQLAEGWCFEGDECFIDETFWDGKFDPSEVIEIRSGDITICYQGSENKPKNECYIDFLPQFLDWKRGYKYEFVVLQVPQGMKTEIENVVRKYLKDKGLGE